MTDNEPNQNGDHQDTGNGRPSESAINVLNSLPEDQLRLLIPFGLHEHCLDADIFVRLADESKAGIPRGMIDSFLTRLTAGELITELDTGLYRIQPGLTAFLRSQVLNRAEAGELDTWSRNFARTYARLADWYAPLELAQQQAFFNLHLANVRRALVLATGLEENMPVMAIKHCLAAYSQNTRNYAEAAILYKEVIALSAEAGLDEFQAMALHQLGMVLGGLKEYDLAAERYEQSLAIKEQLGDREGSAASYHQLGWLAQEQGELGAAMEWYKQALAINEELGSTASVGKSYHQLGRLAQDQGNLEDAQSLFEKALAIKLSAGDEVSAAGTYHELGITAEDLGDLDQAEEYYQTALGIMETHNHEFGIAHTFNQLGNVCYRRKEWLKAAEYAARACGMLRGIGAQETAEVSAKNFKLFMDSAPELKGEMIALWEEHVGELPGSGGDDG